MAGRLALAALILGGCATARTPDVPAEPAAPAAATPEPGPEPEPETTPDAGTTGPDAPEPTAQRPCPPPDHGAHCLWIATRPPNPFRAKHVSARLKKDGFEASADGDRIIVLADDAALGKLFETEVEHGLQPASSSDRMSCVAKLPEDARIASRYRGEVGDFVLDDPTCEL
jgi:hypothetical protein